MNACLYSCVFKTYLQSKKMYSDIYRLKRTYLQLRFLQDRIYILYIYTHTILQNKMMRRCGVPPPPPPPPPIIFDRLKSPQQIIYRQKESLLGSPNHLKYRENILISRFYEHFSRNSRDLGHFWKFEKLSNS